MGSLIEPRKGIGRVKDNMKNYGEEMRQKVQATFLIMIGIAFVLAYYGKSEHMGFVTDWGASIIMSLITTGASQMFIQRASGDFLEKMFLNITIKGKEYSVSIFILATILFKVLLF